MSTINEQLASNHKPKDIIPSERGLPSSAKPRDVSPSERTGAPLKKPKQKPTVGKKPVSPTPVDSTVKKPTPDTTSSSPIRKDRRVHRDTTINKNNVDPSQIVEPQVAAPAPEVKPTRPDKFPAYEGYGKNNPLSSNLIVRIQRELGTQMTGVLDSPTIEAAKKFLNDNKDANFMKGDLANEDWEVLNNGSSPGITANTYNAIITGVRMKKEIDSHMNRQINESLNKLWISTNYRK